MQLATPRRDACSCREGRRKPKSPVTGKWTDSGLFINEALLKIRVSSVNFKVNALSEYNMDKSKLQDIHRVDAVSPKVQNMKHQRISL